MSTSPRLAPDPVARRAPTRPREPQPFPYYALPADASPHEHSTDPARIKAAEDTVATREAQARQLGQAEGEAAARKSFDEQLARERSGVAAALAEFTRDRAAYFQKIEAEVVHLALSIARRILHREAQVDPILLAGIVRVALEKIDGATGVRLRLHPQNTANWQRYLALHLEPADLPEIVEDPAQPPDRCTLETAMGTAEIGLEVQLKEIERGLMDLLAARPGAAQ
jgi:flagellar assembly protein FliH